MKTQDNQLIDLATDLIEWHEDRVANVRLIIDTKDADIVLGDFKTVSADSLEARWLRVGAQLALLQFELFPLSLNPSDDLDEENDDE